MEKEEFSRLVTQNKKRAYFAALGILGSHDAACEVSQEAFIRAYRNFEVFDKSKKFFTWYYKILKNLCLNFIRDSKRDFKIDYLDYADADSQKNNPYDQVEEAELKSKLEAALSELEIEDREILILKEYENYSCKEISELLDIPIGTTMSRLFYARKKLSEKLKRKLG